MSISEIIFEAVSKTTGVSKTKMLSRSRLWPVAEARMLFILFCARLGYDDQSTAWDLHRNRTTILSIRHRAEDYIGISKSFRDKYNKIAKEYENAKSI